jgi:hypothetical protein
MSAKIYQDIREAVTSIRPDLAAEFSQCRDQESIIGFMNRNFPLTKAMVEKPDWHHYLTIHIPEMLKTHMREEWKKEH